MADLERSDTLPTAPGDFATAQAGGPSNGDENATATQPGMSQELNRDINLVLESELAIPTLLNRLKQSIASARDFGVFMKKRSSISEEAASGMKKLHRATLDSINRSDHRGGSYASAFAEIAGAHDRFADNSTKYALALHQIHEDMAAMANDIDHKRKEWKSRGLSAEAKGEAALAAAQKARSKYMSLADDLDRIKTGDKTGRSFGLKGMKSGAQHEEDLKRKVELADEDFMNKVNNFHAVQRELLSTSRPEAVRALRELCAECDSALTMQMQRYASLNERLILDDGMVAVPMADENGNSQRSLRDAVFAIDNNRDFDDHIRGFRSQVPADVKDIKYERHPVSLTFCPQLRRVNGKRDLQARKFLNCLYPPQIRRRACREISWPLATTHTGTLLPETETSLIRSVQVPQPVTTFNSNVNAPQQQASPSGYSPQGPSQYPPQQQQYGTVNTRTSLPSAPTASSTFPQPPPQDRAYAGQQDQKAGYQPSMPVSSHPPQLPQLQSFSDPNHPSHRPPQTLNDSGPPQWNGAGPSQANAYPSYAPAAPPKDTNPAPRPGKGGVFGVHIEELYRREGVPVPYIVAQCIQGVELYGLQVEGIYRIPGSNATINRLRQAFESPNPPDFRDPSSFSHDVNSVAGLLKSFFRDLPDPLLTSATYTDFIDAARLEDEVGRRDSLHAIINALPDPNYATLRALVIHLNHVMEKEEANRMSASNLGICWAPTLMGPHRGELRDAGLQVRVVETILVNCWQIFDED